ncbi:EamA-like transporter family protein [Roseovarius litorisediminis]|uniref:EamA-like transporter family protein n=1 Tax=Roseovarius litorisediminis TaxID=1312363 RepID=A0A1Y5S4L6_9RHOB|nr:DMT family transporter [Roseovarius litorisediminis]SLN32523.1 EamA-like transporter family protein [Roseovarius litorisediminis]
MTVITDLAQSPGRRGYAMGLMVISSVSISFSGLVIRQIDLADPLQINFYRSIALIVSVSLIMVFRYGASAPTHVRRIGRPGLMAGTFLAGAGLAFLQSITNTTVANTLFILSAIPFFTAALAWLFLRESLQRLTVFTMLAALCGICVMVAGGIGAGSLYGNVMALVTALCFSSYAIVVRRHRGIEMLPSLIVSGLVIMVISGLLRWRDLNIPLHDIALCFLLGGVLSGLANALFIAAAKQLVAAELTLFMLLEFALGPIWVWIFISERPTDWTITGGAMVIASVTTRALFELARSHRNTRRLRQNPL